MIYFDYTAKQKLQRGCLTHKFFSSVLLKWSMRNVKFVP